MVEDGYASRYVIESANAQHLFAEMGAKVNTACCRKEHILLYYMMCMHILCRIGSKRSDIQEIVLFAYLVI